MDSLRRVLDTVFAAPAYAWDAHPAAADEAPGWFVRLVHWIAEWFRRLSEWSVGLEDAGIPVRAILVVLAVVLLVRATFQMAEAARRARAQAQEVAVAPRLLRDEAWYWRRAEALAASGLFGGAMLAAFHAAMQSLDRRGLLRYRASATPRELLVGATLPAATRAALDPLVHTLYQVAFAAEPWGADGFNGWLRELRRTVDAPPR